MYMYMYIETCISSCFALASGPDLSAEDFTFRVRRCVR